jgi:hypothetical protein
VHRLPEWLEWTLAVLLGYLVMELVRNIIQSNKYLRLMDGFGRETVPAECKPPRSAG